VSTTLAQVKRDLDVGLKAGGCPAKALAKAVREGILKRINELNDLDRLRAVLDEGVLDHDPGTRLNNIGFLARVAEAEYPKCLAFAQDCRQAGVKDWEREFEAEAKEWSRLFRLACPSLGLDPDPKKRQWYGVSVFHGHRERQRGGTWVREGGQWSQPKHGTHHAFESEESARAWGEMQYGLLAKWSAARGLECPWKVAPMGPKPGEQP
jgi:hypothetical protein